MAFHLSIFWKANKVNDCNIYLLFREIFTLLINWKWSIALIGRIASYWLRSLGLPKENWIGNIDFVDQIIKSEKSLLFPSFCFILILSFFHVIRMNSTSVNLIKIQLQFICSHAAIDQMQNKRNKKIRNIFLDFLNHYYSLFLSLLKHSAIENRKFILATKPGTW